MGNLAAPELMPKLVIGMQNKHGFTLIEILVVVLIIGITLGFALLAFGDFGRQRRIVMAAEQFVNYVKFAEQQAILETSTLGIKIYQNRYQLLRLQPSEQWEALSQNSIFQPHFFPDGTIIHLDGPRNTALEPQLIINSSGDITPFTLHFGVDEKPSVAVVMGKHNGVIALQLGAS